MDYKEKYEMALEGIQEILGSGEDSIKMSRLQLRLQGIFPELKEESEDERIRKELTEFLKSASRGFLNSAIRRETFGEWLAWLEKQGNSINCIYDKELSELLHIVICRYVNDPDISYIEKENVSKKIFPYVELLEKQGEHANFLNNIQIGDKVTRNEDGVLVNLSQLKRVAKKDEKQGELIGDTDTVDSNENGLIAETMKYKREQKSAWSEEDEKMLDTVIEDIVKLAGPYICYHTDVEWLKSLKDRVQPKLKQEWSEEDINMLQSILDEYKSMPIEKRNWLKSLRPQKINPRFPQYENIVDKVFGVGNLETWEREEAEQLVLLAKEEVEKALRLQKQWKPTEEQMKALHDLNLTGGISYAGQGQTLIELYNNLNKL